MEATFANSARIGKGNFEGNYRDCMLWIVFAFRKMNWRLFASELFFLGKNLHQEIAKNDERLKCSSVPEQKRPRKKCSHHCVEHVFLCTPLLKEYPFFLWEERPHCFPWKLLEIQQGFPCKSCCLPNSALSLERLTCSDP